LWAMQMLCSLLHYHSTFNFEDHSLLIVGHVHFVPSLGFNPVLLRL
jgi:hypothetical protein